MWYCGGGKMKGNRHEALESKSPAKAPRRKVKMRKTREKQEPVMNADWREW